VSGPAHAWLSSTGYDPAYGARPLRRLVQTSIGDPLARMLIAGQVLDGQHVVVDTEGEGLALRVVG
jgi:ATP-dependent Clp protease ATP-binding subunit ClpB